MGRQTSFFGGMWMWEYRDIEPTNTWTWAFIGEQMLLIGRTFTIIPKKAWNVGFQAIWANQPKLCNIEQTRHSMYKQTQLISSRRYGGLSDDPRSNKGYWVSSPQIFVSSAGSNQPWQLQSCPINVHSNKPVSMLLHWLAQRVRPASSLNPLES